MTATKLIGYTLAMVVSMCSAQNPPQTTQPPAEPGMTQIRKCVTFIQLLCKEGNQEFDVRGTGFFIAYPDSRLGKEGGFIYLVTNRHIAQCWNDSDRPMQVERISIRLNRRQAEGDSIAQDLVLNPIGNVPWVLPQDDSVDLAIFPILPDINRFDFKVVPVSILMGKDELAQQGITEGEPVFFAGFFYQFPGVKRMEPIIRQGIIAMMPQDKVPFVGTAMKVYLADLHVFGGNSGSPAFINLSGYHRGGMVLGADNYRLLGVVNGEVTEDEKFNLELATTLKGTGKGNSGVSTIVPSDEVKALLDDPRLQKLRDDIVKTQAGGPSLTTPK
jgi:hypothetical protein